MKLMIDIPEDMHKRLKDDVIGYSDGGIIINSIRNGTPIPDEASWSDLISRQAVYEDVRDTIAMFIPFFNSYTDKIPLEVAKAIMRIPPATIAK